MEDLLAGFQYKACSKGKSWKKRFVVANSTAGTLAWFQDDPSFSLAKYRVKEEPLGEVKLRGATIFTADGQPSKVCPLPFLLKIVAPERTQLMCFATKEQQEKWRAFVQRAADPVAAREAEEAERAAREGTKGATRPSVAHALTSASSLLSSEPVDFCGWLLKAAPGWRTFQKRYCVLDCEELNLSYYEKAPDVDELYRVLGDQMPQATESEDLPPIENDAAREVIKLLMLGKMKPKGRIPLRGATISTKAWSSTGDAAGFLATSPTFSLTSESGRVYAFVASTKPEMAEWIARLQQAIDEADRVYHSGLLMGARPRAASGETGAEDADAGGEVTQKQARRLSTVVPFKRAARSTMAGSRAPGLPLYAAFLQNKNDRAAGYLYKVDKSGRRWAYRYFVLRGNVASYYADHTRRELKGSFTIGSNSRYQEGFPASASALEPPTEFLFTISAETEGTSDGGSGGGNASSGSTGLRSESTRLAAPIKGHAAREHYLAANSPAEVKAWVDVFTVLVSAHRAKDGLEAFNEGALARIEGGSGSSSASKKAKAGAGSSHDGDDEEDGVGELVGLNDDHHDDGEDDGATIVVKSPAAAAAAASSSSATSSSSADTAKEVSASLTATLRNSLLAKASQDEADAASAASGGSSGSKGAATAAGLGSVPEDKELEGAAAGGAAVAPSASRAAPPPSGRFARISVGGEDL
jgi:PH domain